MIRTTTRTTTRTTAALLGFLGLAACGQDGGRETTSEPAESAWAVKLLDPGAEPRAPLRHRFVNGTKTYDLLQTTTAGEGADKKTQTTRATVDVTVDDANPADARLVVTLRGLTTDGAPFTSAAGSSAGQELVVTSRADARGRVTGMTATLSGDAADPSHDARRENLGSVVAEETKQALPPLPEEPIGVGARWEVAGTTSVLGMTVPTSSEMRLESLEGSTATVRVTTHATVRDRGLPSDGEKAMVLKTFDMTITGTQRFGGDLVFGEGEIRSKTRIVGLATSQKEGPQRWSADSESTLSLRARR